ncbi:MAG: plasmid mobilization relaxosome protein MobC [Hyphomonas sp.]|nr:plasmid mobilization relaxosome protein MobC [Hyphomonas sp.]
MARPTKAENEKRTERYNLRLTLAEREWLASQARAAGLSEIDYVRRRILGQPVANRRTVTDPALIAELNAIGHNVNQLARATHTGRQFQQYWREIGDELRRVLALALEGVGGP